MKAKVLLVDDEPAVLGCLTAALARHGHIVTTAASGEAALAELKHQRFDLVVTDFRMSGLSGAAVVEAVRERHDETAIILITGLVDELPVWLRTGPHAVRVVAKPFALRPFLHEVDLALAGATVLAR